MATYLIEVMDSEGNRQKKVLEVETEEDVFRIIEFSGLIPVKVKKIPSIYARLNPKRLFYRVKAGEIIEVLENLHLVVKTGVPIADGLLDIAKDTENPFLREILTDIAYRIKAGYSLSKAFGHYSNVFPPIVISLIQLGEETGSLDKTLKDAAEHLKRIEDIKAKTKQALIYPSFALVSIIGALTFWLVYVLPKIIDAFKELNVELPITTVIVMEMSYFTRKYLPYIVAVLIVLAVVVKIGRSKSWRFRYETDKLLLKLPVFGNILTSFNLAFFSEYLRLMISSGLPLYQALYILERAIGNLVFKTAVKNARERIEQGSSFSDALKEEGVFPPLVIRMVAIGEKAGGLEQQLEYISQYYYNRVDYLAQNIAKMIEPIVIGIVGAFMLLIMIGLIGPVYDLISKIAQMQ
ncbi:MAG: type II secretion system F family protein [Aquificae bacterium]|nr:type II secretion system F family protein [Aquificota bacterium]